MPIMIFCCHPENRHAVDSSFRLRFSGVANRRKGFPHCVHRAGKEPDLLSRNDRVGFDLSPSFPRVHGYEGYRSHRFVFEEFDTNLFYAIDSLCELDRAVDKTREPSRNFRCNPETANSFRAAGKRKQVHLHKCKEKWSGNKGQVRFFLLVALS